MPLLPQGGLCENMLGFAEIVENMNSLCVNVKEKLLCLRTPRLCENMLSFSQIVENMNSLGVIVNVKST